MTHFSSEAVRIDHLGCVSSMVFTMEWPPRIVMCPGCGQALKLVGQDDETQRLAYRTL